MLYGLLAEKLKKKKIQLIKFYLFPGSRKLLQCLLQPTTKPYPKSDKTNPHASSLFFKTHFNITLSISHTCGLLYQEPLLNFCVQFL